MNMCWVGTTSCLRVSHTMANANESELEDLPASFKSVVWEPFGFSGSYNSNGGRELWLRQGRYVRMCYVHFSPCCTKLTPWSKTVTSMCRHTPIKDAIWNRVVLPVSILRQIASEQFNCFLWDSYWCVNPSWLAEGTLCKLQRYSLGK